MILADTSVWIDHFRSSNKDMQSALIQGQITVHPWITAELALGSLKERKKTLALLDLLPEAPVAHLSEVRQMIETRSLHSLGIGLTDAQLIASALLSPPTQIWTKDKQLRKIAESLGIHARVP